MINTYFTKDIKLRGVCYRRLTQGLDLDLSAIIYTAEVFFSKTLDPQQL